VSRPIHQDLAPWSIVYNFAGPPDGDDPQAPLVALDGTLYGTTCYGGVNNEGSVFALTPGVGETVIHSFTGADGDCPMAGLIDVKGTLYGTTSGALGGDGNVFSITPSGTFHVLYTFAGGFSDGEEPMSGLTYFGGALYGTTEYAGANSYGAIFKVQVTGNDRGHESLVYSFKGAPDAARPLAGVVHHGGMLYGNTFGGGANSEGAVYAVTLGGSEKVLYSFGSTAGDGAYPQSDLLFSKGDFYGTASQGGDTGPNCGGPGCGTVFSITPKGKYKTV
jgi:uncharacterized repeat protein (TIGR03803 family)